MMVGSIYSVNTIQGIIRPSAPAFIPKENGGSSVLIDVGTNPDAKPDVMYQFGILGSIYAENIYKIPNPRVALLNLGAEPEKGNLLTQSSFALMKDSNDFNFTGNVVLKLMESVYRILMKRGVKDDYMDTMNYENYGGTPLLGVNSTVIVGHGISNDKAIKNMILLSKEVTEVQLSEKIREALQRFSINTKE